MSHIVVVDDSDVLRSIIAKTIRDLGHEVIEAKDGKEAFPLIRDGKFDLVVTDLRMPEWSGYRLLTELRAAGSTVPVIMCSAAPDEHALNPYQNVGFAAVLAKNETLVDTLPEAIRNFIVHSS